jgi:MFS family permease
MLDPDRSEPPPAAPAEPAEPAEPQPEVEPNLAPATFGPERARGQTSVPPAEPVVGAAEQHVGAEPAINPTEPAISAAEIPLPAEPFVPQRRYELPTARKVVATGLQLSLASTSELRRASIYIGLLILAAFGPAAVAFLLVIGRLGDSAGDVLTTLLFSPELMAETQPELGGVLLVLMLVAIGGLTSYTAISIDASNIAIAILGGRSADKPMRLWEAITRSRQAFWRVAGAGFLVGLIGGVIQLAISALVGAFTTSVETSSVITAVVGTLLISPFAYVAASIVLGDVGATEALSRSWRLFRVRPWLGIVVVLFTLVTSAIQLFALSAGLDLLIRAGELLHVSLTEGALEFAIGVVLVLAAVTAFGSLLFTVGAIVAAPQVAGFLGLTFFSGGLDKARSAEPRPHKGFHWVTRPMLALLIVTALVVGLELPAINAIEPVAPVSLEPDADGLLSSFLQDVADPQHQAVSTYGFAPAVEDPPLDSGTGGNDDVDLRSAEIGVLWDVPGWFVNTTLDCAADAVGCSVGGSYPQAFYADGALLVAQHMGAAPTSQTRGLGEWGAVLDVEGSKRAPFTTGLRFSGATHAVVTRLNGRQWETVAFVYDGTAFREQPTDARSIWLGATLVTVIPVRELDGYPVAWDAYASGDTVMFTTRGRDMLRNGPMAQLLELDEPTEYEFVPTQADD